MTILDWIIVGILVISAGISIIRGFVKEAISLATWVLAFWVALAFAAKLALLMPESLESPTLRWGAAAVALFMATLLVGGLANFLISTLVEKTGLSGTDRALGVVFGALRGVAIVALLVLVAGDTTLREEDWWFESRLRPSFDAVAAWMRAHYPADMAESLLSQQ
jgi:membrane protein required for colicin V production